MLTLIQGYYHFLSLGKFMEGVILSNDLSKIALDYPIKTWENTSFLLKKSLLSSLLASCHKHPDKRNVYGYLLEISAFKGIFSSVRELIESNPNFRNFLKNQLADQYFPFEQTIRFLRNVLNHATTGNLEIKLEDYDIQKDYILSPKVQKTNQLKGSASISLNFLYAKYINQRKGSSQYWIHLSIDFNQLKPGIALEKIISRHNLYLLSELCFNLTQIAQHQSSTKKSQSSIPAQKDKSLKKIKKSDSKPHSSLKSTKRKKLDNT